MYSKTAEYGNQYSYVVILNGWEPIYYDRTLVGMHSAIKSAKERNGECYICDAKTRDFKFATKLWPEN